MKKILKSKLVAALFLLLVAFLAILAYNTMKLGSQQIDVKPVANLTLDEKVVMDNLSKAVQLPTISYSEGEKKDTAAFRELLDYMAVTYPLCDSLLTKEIVNDWSLLYTWPGNNPDLKPAMLIAHTDVVPVEDASSWDVPAFSGKLQDGYLWGRGTLDDKVSVLGIMEAVEILLKEGFQPKQTIFLGFGHDEEIGGANGAGKITQTLKERGIQLDFVLDEGSAIVEKVMPGVESPVALIGLAEKGYVNIELKARVKGGHSSMPELETSVGVLSKAIVDLQKNQMPARFCEPVSLMFDCAGAEMPFPLKTVMANRWLFGGLLNWQLSQSPSTNATIRTTTAPTILEGSVKENVLPAEARAVVNFRILPGETVQDVLTHVRKTVKDERISIAVSGDEGNNPSPVSSIDTKAYQTIHQSIKEVFPGVVVAPSLTIGGTDCKHYVAIADNAYRFLPVLLNSEDLKRFHGVNERISPGNYQDCIRFYYQLIKNLNQS